MSAPKLPTAACDCDCLSDPACACNEACCNQ